VVGAEHDDDAVEAALALVEVVGEVAGDVGRLAVALDDDAVLVVAELARAQPDRTVGLVDVSEFARRSTACSTAPDSCSEFSWK
jgi:hypothetical protein